MKKISSRKFVICGYYNKEVPKQDEGCCDFYDHSTGRCAYKSARISKRQMNRLSEREENYNDFNQQQSEEY
jgi:hypothetical protein